MFFLKFCDRIFRCSPWFFVIKHYSQSCTKSTILTGNFINLIQSAQFDVWVFQSVVKEIKYFAGLNLISTSDVMYLKNELQQLLTDLEHLSIKGEFNEGHELYIYLSNIDFEATYSYVSRKDYQISLFRVYSINSMDSQSPQICQIQKNWIQSLKRHSTLISGSGEAQRIAFIEKQRNIIDVL